MVIRVFILNSQRSDEYEKVFFAIIFWNSKNASIFYSSIFSGRNVNLVGTLEKVMVLRQNQFSKKIILFFSLILKKLPHIYDIFIECLYQLYTITFSRFCDSFLSYIELENLININYYVKVKIFYKKLISQQIVVIMKSSSKD